MRKIEEEQSLNTSSTPESETRQLLKVLASGVGIAAFVAASGAVVGFTIITLDNWVRMRDGRIQYETRTAVEALLRRHGNKYDIS